MGFDRNHFVVEAQRQLKLAWPVMLTSLNWTLMHMIDVAIVGRAGTGELGALAGGRALTFVTMIIGIAALSGVIVFASRLDGAGERHKSGDVLRQGLTCAALFSFPTALIMYLWPVQITTAMGIEASFIAEGSVVVQMMALAFPAQLLLAAMAYFLEGVSRPNRAMVVNLLLLPPNALLAWAWVNGHAGLPASGAVGAVAATAVVSWMGVLMMAVALWTLPGARGLGIRNMSRAAWLDALRRAPELMRFGIVPGAGAGLEMAGFSFLIILSTRLGTVATDAFQATFALHNFAFAMVIGLSSAAGVRTGNAVGEGRPDLALPRTMVATSLMLMGLGLLIAFYISAAPAVAGLFSRDAPVQAMTVSMVRTLAPFMLFDGAQLIFVYALRSLGDQVVAGLNGIVAFTFVTGGLGWWLVSVQGRGPDALVIAAAAGMVAAALLQSLRLFHVSRRGRLQNSG